MPWYKGDPTGQRRVYIRWGKQAYELQRWVEAPYDSIVNKSSQLVRWAVEMATGTSVGGQQWDLPFKDMGLMGLFMDEDGKFMGSRAGYTVQKFMPFSLLAWAKNTDAAPLQIVGPVSKGMGFRQATEAYMGVLEAWAKDKHYAKFYKNPKIKANLEALGPEIMDAAERNGYNPEKVLNSARGAVLKELYANLYKAIDRNDTRDLERWSRAIVRVNGTVQSTLRSVKNRNDLYGKPEKLSDEQRELINQAFQKP
jgi:hypothetical protein